MISRVVEPERGEIWLGYLDSAPPAVVHEQAGRRPLFIVSDNRYNNGPAGLVIVVPLTSKLRGIRLHVVVQPPEGGLRQPSAILCDQIRSISKVRLIQKWGALSPNTVRQVETRIRAVLQL